MYKPRHSYKCLNDDHLITTCDKITANELNFFEGLSKCRSRGIILVNSLSVQKFMEYSDQPDKIQKNKRDNETNKQYLLRTLGLSKYTLIESQQKGTRDKMAIPFNVKDNTSFSEHYHCICFVMNDNNLHWSLLVYFFDEDVWRNYDSIASSYNKSSRFNDAISEIFLNQLNSQGIIERDRERDVRIILKNLNAQFPCQRWNWECGYYVILFVNFLHLKDTHIRPNEYYLFNDGSIQKVYEYLN